MGSTALMMGVYVVAVEEDGEARARPDEAPLDRPGACVLGSRPRPRPRPPPFAGALRKR